MPDFDKNNENPEKIILPEEDNPKKLELKAEQYLEDDKLKEEHVSGKGIKFKIDLGDAREPSREKPQDTEDFLFGEEAEKIDEKPTLKLGNVYQPKGAKWGMTEANTGKSKNKSELKRVLYFVGDLLLDVLIVVAIVVFIRMFIASPFKVKGSSMVDTFENGDYIIVDEVTYRFSGPERGDVIVFNPPIDNNLIQEEGIMCSFRKIYATVFGKDTENACMVPEYFVKRVIGVPGDTVIIKQGKVYLQPKYTDEQIDVSEDYLKAENKSHTCLTPSNTCATTLDMEGKTFEVPEGSYFVLGDNRNGSNDSRHWKNNGEASPYVPLENIRGKVRVTIWPFGQINVTDSPEMLSE